MNNNNQTDDSVEIKVYQNRSYTFNELKNICTQKRIDLDDESINDFIEAYTEGQWMTFYGYPIVSIERELKDWERDLYDNSETASILEYQIEESRSQLQKVEKEINDKYLLLEFLINKTKEINDKLKKQIKITRYN